MNTAGTVTAKSNILTLFQQLPVQHLHNIQHKTTTRYFDAKEKLEFHESKFHQTSEFKSNLANAWASTEVKWRQQIADAERKQNTAKITYIAEYLQYHKAINDVKKSSIGLTSLDNALIASVLQPIELQKMKLRNAESYFIAIKNEVEFLKQIKSKELDEYPQKFQLAKREHVDAVNQLNMIKQEFTMIKNQLDKVRRLMNRVNEEISSAEANFSSKIRKYITWIAEVCLVTLQHKYSPVHKQQTEVKSSNILTSSQDQVQCN